MHQIQQVKAATLTHETYVINETVKTEQLKAETTPMTATY